MTTSSYGVSVPVVPVEREKKSSMTCSPPPDDIDEYQISQLMEQGFTRGMIFPRSVKWVGFAIPIENF